VLAPLPLPKTVVPEGMAVNDCPVISVTVALEDFGGTGTVALGATGFCVIFLRVALLDLPTLGSSLSNSLMYAVTGLRVIAINYALVVPIMGLWIKTDYGVPH
jgi:hypothetical protein